MRTNACWDHMHAYEIILSSEEKGRQTGQAGRQGKCTLLIALSHLSPRAPGDGAVRRAGGSCCLGRHARRARWAVTVGGIWTATGSTSHWSKAACTPVRRGRSIRGSRCSPSTAQSQRSQARSLAWTGRTWSERAYGVLLVPSDKLSHLRR